MNRAFTPADNGQRFTDHRPGVLEFPLTDPGSAARGQAILWYDTPDLRGKAWRYVSPHAVEPILDADAPPVPPGLRPRSGVEYGCGVATCTDCYETTSPVPILETCPRCGVTAPAAQPCPTGCGAEHQVDAAAAALPDIFTLWRAVEEHPDFAAGTIFVRGSDTRPLTDAEADELQRRLGDALAEHGNQFIADQGLSPEEN